MRTMRGTSDDDLFGGDLTFTTTKRRASALTSHQRPGGVYDYDLYEWGVAVRRGRADAMSLKVVKTGPRRQKAFGCYAHRVEPSCIFAADCFLNRLSG